MFETVATPTATFEAAAILAIVAASFLVAKRTLILDLTSFAFWQAVVGTAIGAYQNKKATSAAKAQAGLDQLAMLKDTAAAAKASAEARLENDRARNAAMSRSGISGCAFYVVLLLAGLATVLVLACR